MRAPLIIISALLIVVAGFYAWTTLGTRSRLNPPARPTAADEQSPAAPPPVTAADPVRGNRAAAITIIEYGDFLCESCRAAEPVLRALLATRNDVRLVWRDAPAGGSTTASGRAAIAARCAGEQQKFWEYHDALLAREDLLINPALDGIAAEIGLDAGRFAACLSDERQAALLTASLEQTVRLDLRGVPEFYLNGVRYDGPHTVAGFISVMP